MLALLAHLCIAILLFGAVLHFYWGFGGRVGYEASLPRRATGERLFEPPWWGGHLVGVVMLAACWLVLATAHLLPSPLPISWTRIAVALMGAGFVLRALWATPYAGLFKSHHHSAFAYYDTRLYAPLFLILGAGLLVVAWLS